MTAQERLLALVNQRVSGKALRLGDVIFGLPVAIPESNGVNTELTLLGVTEAGYFNEHKLSYRRIDLATIPVSLEVTLPAGSAVDTIALVDRLNIGYGLDIDHNDVVIEDNIGTTYQLKAVPNGLRWLGEVTVKVHRMMRNIEPTLTVTTLGEFT